MAAWLGGGLSSLAFNIVALRVTDPHLLNATFIFAEILHTSIIRGGAAGTFVSGILLALLTQWGLVRFYWIIAKEILTVLAIAVDLTLIRWTTLAIDLTAAQGLDAFSSPFYLSNRTLLLVGSGFQLSLLVIVIGIAIFKPWGQRKRRNPKSDMGLAQPIITGKMAKATNASGVD
jgi:hypothetical protein